MNIKTPTKVALVDADSLVFYCSLSSTESPVPLEEAMGALDQRIDDILSTCNSTHYMLFTSPDRKSVFRSEVAAIRGYKENRKKLRFPPVFAGLKSYLRHKPSYQGDNFEADDAIGLFQNYFGSLEVETIVCSPDKDVLRQLSGTHYNYGKGELVTTTPESAERFIFKQVLMGDSADNVQGIPKIGDKKSDKMLDGIHPDDFPKVCLGHYTDYFGSLEGIRNFMETFRLVYLLRTREDFLRECDLDADEDFCRRIVYGDENHEGHLLISDTHGEWR